MEKFLIVSFNDNYINYTGTIHISELENKFIDEEYYRTNYNVGDSFNAKIISFDEKYQDWRLSKKRCD